MVKEKKNIIFSRSYVMSMCILRYVRNGKYFWYLHSVLFSFLKPKEIKDI